MKTFLIRLQFNAIGHREPSSQIYDQAHVALGEMAAIRTIVGADGGYYETPHATYIMVSSQSAAQVRDQVAARVERIWADISLLVVEYGDAAWKLKQTQSVPKPIQNGLLGAGLAELFMGK